MSAAQQEHAMSVRTFLLGDPSAGDDVTRFAQAIRESGVVGTATGALGGLTRAARDDFAEQLAATVGPVLQLDLGDILVLGWAKHQEVTAAARRSLQSDGPPETVYLVSHQIISTHHPLVDLLLDGTRVHRFTFDLTITIDLAGAALRIKNGRLVDARFGRATAIAELQLQDMHRPLVRQQRDIDLRPALRFRDGIPLLRQPPPHQAAGRRR